MIIENDKVVSIVYELRDTNIEGEVIETLDNSAPLSFIFGKGNLLPKFEANLDGLKVGDKFEFGLSPEEAYGEQNPQAIVDVPKNIFEVDGKVDTNLVFIGNRIPMRDNQGNRLDGIVIDITDENVKMDFNHPMAGKQLHFNGEVTEIREATEEELAHGHVHQAGGCGSCSTDHDSCGGSCSC